MGVGVALVGTVLGVVLPEVGCFDEPVLEVLPEPLVCGLVELWVTVVVVEVPAGVAGLLPW